MAIVAGFPARRTHIKSSSLLHLYPPVVSHLLSVSPFLSFLFFLLHVFVEMQLAIFMNCCCLCV